MVRSNLTLRLPVLGTSAAGKSIIGNLLCGRFVLPFGLRHPTTCLTEISHIPDEGSIFLRRESDGKTESVHHKLDGAAREHLQKWMQDSSVDPISVQLAMNTIPLSRGFARIAAMLRGQGGYLLPRVSPVTSYCLIDTPGLQSGSRNAEAAIQRLAMGTCTIPIFVFNAEETDEEKEKQYLEQILLVAREAECGWDRFFFILNRADAFARDGDEGEALASQVRRRGEQAAQLLQKVYRIEKISPVIVHPLAGWPAFAAESLRRGSRKLSADDWRFLYERANEFGRALLSDDILAQMPRRTSDWQIDHARQFGQQLRAVSFIEPVLKALHAQICQFTFGKKSLRS